MDQIFFKVYSVARENFSLAGTCWDFCEPLVIHFLLSMLRKNVIRNSSGYIRDPPHLSIQESTARRNTQIAMLAKQTNLQGTDKLYSFWRQQFRQ